MERRDELRDWISFPVRIANNPYPPSEGLHYCPPTETREHCFNKEGNCWCNAVVKDSVFIHSDEEDPNYVYRESQNKKT